MLGITTFVQLRDRLSIYCLNHPLDPFSLKSLPKWHIRRAAWTAYARVIEKHASIWFTSTVIPSKSIDGLAAPQGQQEETAVTPLQLSYLAAAVRAAEELSSTVVVEVGSYRGITTQALARETRRVLFAVDPYIGYGGAEDDYKAFIDRIGQLPNARHLRLTSGEASRRWTYESAGFVFIDAVHDYVNTNHDIKEWGAKLQPGGLLALHDTDNPRFPGTRRAAFEALKTMDLWAHVHDLVILRGR